MNGRIQPIVCRDRTYTLESQADLHALRAVGCTDRIVYVIALEGVFYLSEQEEAGAVTRWSRWGCKSLRPVTPLVEMR